MFFFFVFFFFFKFFFFKFFFRVRIALGTVHMLSLTLYNRIILIHPQLIRLEIWLSTYFNLTLLCSFNITLQFNKCFCYDVF